MQEHIREHDNPSLPEIQTEPFVLTKCIACKRQGNCPQTRVRKMGNLYDGATFNYKGNVKNCKSFVLLANGIARFFLIFSACAFGVFAMGNFDPDIPVSYVGTLFWCLLAAISAWVCGYLEIQAKRPNRRK